MPTASEDFERSAAVFVGRVVKQEYSREWSATCVPDRDFASTMVRDPEVPSFGFQGSLSVTFEVERAWKGVSSRVLLVGGSIGSCGYPFEMGREYLVFAVGTPGGLGAYYCHRTAPMHPFAQENRHAAADVASFGPAEFDPLTEYEAARADHVRACLEKR
jgi:hypothetical protein